VEEGPVLVHANCEQADGGGAEGAPKVHAKPHSLHRVGAMGYIGNNGAVSVSMSVYHTMFCFTWVQLTSDEKPDDMHKWNVDVLEIHRWTHFATPCDIPRTSTATSEYSANQHSSPLIISKGRFSSEIIDSLQLQESSINFSPLVGVA
jgi:hypothetical protein